LAPLGEARVGSSFSRTGNSVSRDRRSLAGPDDHGRSTELPTFRRRV
jgi:hypothetical protein